MVHRNDSGKQIVQSPKDIWQSCYCERVSVQEWVGGPLINENYYVVDSICSMHQKCRQMKRERRLCSGKIIDKRGRENENNGLEQRTTFWMRTHCYTQDTKVPPHPPKKKEEKRRRKLVAQPHANIHNHRGRRKRDNLNNAMQHSRAICRQEEGLDRTNI